MNTMKIFIEVFDLNLLWVKILSSFETENYVCGKQNRTAEKKCMYATQLQWWTQIKTCICRF